MLWKTRPSAEPSCRLNVAENPTIGTFGGVDFDDDGSETAVMITFGVISELKCDKTLR